MADMSTAAVGVNSAPNIQQPVGEQDFAQIKKPVETTKQESRFMTPAEKEEAKQKQEALLKPGTVPEATVSQITEAFNELMDKIDCNLELSYNRKANMLNVKMVDKESGEVIKEFPPEEMIENMIKAEELRGAFIDRAV